MREINHQAHVEAMQFEAERRAELIAKAGITPWRFGTGRRRVAAERNKSFHAFVIERLDEGCFDDADDRVMDLIQRFLETPTINNRIKLLAAFKRHKNLLGDRLAELDKFA
jgi:hypothetical protein